MTTKKSSVKIKHKRSSQSASSNKTKRKASTTKTKRANAFHEKGVKLKKLRIKNFKVFEDFELDFPTPLMKDDPDILVMGSKNGLGKTSVLEASTLLFIAALFGGKPFEEMRLPRHKISTINLPEIIIRAGSKKASIEGSFLIKSSKAKVKFILHRNGKTEVTGDTSLFKQIYKEDKNHDFSPVEMSDNYLFSLMGLDPEPILLPPLLYFHSYRKVQEGSPELGAMIESEIYYPRRYRRRDMVISAFKLAILRSMMSKGGLFENIEDLESEKVLDTLNKLMKKYAGGSIEKLRPSEDNTVEFRISMEDGGNTFSFDGLSSGQKEIISTLFLIWQNTRKMPGIVLIDEPELHLNIEWEHEFIRSLYDLAPQNQYIIATHSEDVFASVSPDRRIILEPVKRGS